jgi:AAA+ ATPase superfamily predicted ATPase
MTPWKFYGHKEQLAVLERMLDRKRWFFAKVTGRSRIGKTTRIHQAIQEIKNQQPVLYVQIPDSESTGVLSAVSEALDTLQVPSDQYPPK